MKKAKCLLVFSFLSLTLFSCSSIHPVGKKYSFTYANNCGGDYSENMYYTDDYFSKPSTTYNPSLATASLIMAMSSFSSKLASSERDYSSRYHNNQKLMESLGFSNYQTNQYFKEKPGTDSMGATYCSKALDDGSTLIAIGLRGQGYDMEWASNFKLGEAEEYQGKHAGFYEASQIILSGLKDFVSEANISGDIKIWVSGYSRAGAACNLFSGALDEALVEGKTLINGVDYQKEDIYSYCFEPPMGAYLDENNTPHGEDFNNIFNIVNREDPVPKVAMKEFGFTRYGIDCFVSDPLSDPYYSDDIQKVVSVYDNMKASKVHGDYVVDDFVFYSLGFKENKMKLTTSSTHVHWIQGLYLDRFISRLTTIGVRTRENYDAYFQPGLTSLFAGIYAEGAPKASLIDVGIQCVWAILKNNETEILMDDIQHQRQWFSKDVLTLVQDSLDTLGIEIDFRILEDGLNELLEAVALTLFSDINLLFPLLSVDNIKGIGSAHYPDLCLAHMMARDPNYSEEPITSSLSGEYYLLEIPYESPNINVKVEQGDEVVALFEDGQPVVENSSIVYGREDNELKIYLPKDGDYLVESNDEDINLSLYHPNSLSYEAIETDMTKVEDNILFQI